MKILIVRLDHLGDLLLATPLLRALARAGHEVDLVVPRVFLPLFAFNPHVRECLAMEEVSPGFPASWLRFGAWMRRRKYEVVLLPNPRPRALLLSSLFSGAKKRVALQGGIVGRLTGHRCLRIGPAFAQRRHYADVQLDLARALDVAPDGEGLDFFVQPGEIAAAEKTLGDVFAEAPAGPLVGIHPGCAGNTCNLPPRVYGELAEIILAQSNARVIMTGSEKERALTEGWPTAVMTSPRVWLSAGGLDLRELGAVIGRLAVYVVPSTGPLHLASALGVRTVSPFCPLPQLGAEVWGSRGGPGVAVGPALAACEARRCGAKSAGHCDFRGEVTAENLWAALEKLL
jgi:heptosyltransferase-2